MYLSMFNKWKCRRKLHSLYAWQFMRVKKIFCSIYAFKIFSFIIFCVAYSCKGALSHQQRMNLVKTVNFETSFIFMIRSRLLSELKLQYRRHQLIFQGKGHPVFGRDALISFSGPIYRMIFDSFTDRLYFWAFERHRYICCFMMFNNNPRVLTSAW